MSAKTVNHLSPLEMFIKKWYNEHQSINGDGKMKKVGIHTLGCKVNQYESAVIAEGLDAQGFTVSNFGEVCDYYVINTCTVTGEADRKSRQMIRRAIKTNPDAKIIVTGCLAEVAGERLESIDGIDVIVGNREKTSIVGIIKRLENKLETAEVHVPTLDSDFEKMCLTGKYGGTTDERCRAYVKICDGCESSCTYCIIPRARGKICSKAPNEVLREIENLVKSGFLEVVLTGIETGSYGKDLDNLSLADLLCLADKAEKIERIRLGSLDPSLMRADFVKKVSRLKHLTPHFHLSLQSGCDKILALMKRKYNTKMFLEYMENIRASIPDVMFTTDIICGFPGETEEDFLETVEFVRRARFLGAHVFAYSKREGTPAAGMPNQVPANIASERVNRLYAVVKEVSQELLSEYDNRVLSVIAEDYKAPYAIGHTANFIEVKVKCTSKEYEKIHARLADVLLSVKGAEVFGTLV